jgi:hypothetical protein
MLLAARQWKLQRSIADGQVKAKAERKLPPVQRPGVAVDHRATINEAGIRQANDDFRRNPSVRNAAKFLSAKRRAT